MPKKTAGTDLHLPSLARWVAEESLLFSDAAAPFQARVADGDPRLVVIVGENAAGKSLFFRILAQKATMGGATAVTLSIRERSGGGMRQAFMYGDESDQSTGATSVQTVITGFKNVDRPNGSVLGLDEPELGLSDGYAEAFGAYIGAQARTITDVCAGVIVVTHSRRLVRGLLDGYGAAPTFVRVGDGAADIDGWLAETEVRTVEELLALPEVNLDQWRTTLRILKD